MLKRIMAVALMSVLALTMAAPAALAEETTCRGTTGKRTVDNLRVPSGATCTLNGTRVEGTIKLENGATLNASGVRVKGNLQSEGFRAISVKNGSTFGGSVQLKNGQGNANIANARINGDLHFETNFGPISASKNTVLANLQAVGNTGGVSLTNNTIAENLQCKENNPAPTGGGNKAGDKEDQCARL